MDIHKPKPWHGLREFLKEYVIIVVGVLTALAAEQTVEWLHWQEKTEAAERLVAQELSAAHAWANERAEVTPCLDRRLAALEDRLLATGSAWTPLPPMIHPAIGPAVYETPFRNWNTEAWHSITADGTIGHLSRDRQISLGIAYNQIQQLAEMQRQEESDIGELNVLARPLDLDRTQRVGLVRLIEHERWRAKLMASLSKQNRDRIPKLVKLEKLPGGATLADSGTWRACKALGLLAAADGDPRT